MKVLDKALKTFFTPFSLSEPYVLAFSGGSDSLALLLGLKKLNLVNLKVVYVNHKLRDEEELSKEIELNRSNVNALGYDLIVRSLREHQVEEYAEENSLSIEAAARVLRYKILDEYNLKVITAHNAEDQCESLVMKMLFSSPFLSYSGIWEKQEKRLRPLLSVNKQDILDYVLSSGFKYSQDSTNDVLFCRRNKIRKSISLSKSEKDLLLSIASNMQKVRIKYSNINVVDNKLYRSFDKNEFLSSHLISQEIALNKLLNSSTIVSRMEKDRIIEHIKNNRSYNAKDYYIRIKKDKVYYFAKMPNFVFPIKDGLELFNSYVFTSCLDSDALSLDISNAIIRLSETGDEIILDGKSKKVSSLLKDWKIPYAIVVENQSQIIAVFASIFDSYDRISSDLKSAGWQNNKKYKIKLK